jgi:hypothetical protein
MIGKGGSDRAEQNGQRTVSADDETGDEDVFASYHACSRRKIVQPGMDEGRVVEFHEGNTTVPGDTSHYGGIDLR